MKERRERLIVLPFSTGCSSQASVAVGKTPHRKPKPEPTSTQNPTSKQEVGEECSSKGRTKNSFGNWLTLSKPNISNGIHRFLRITVKSFSQLFVYKDIEEVRSEMEIGYPTDVKHVTHIGLDGSTSSTSTTTTSNGLKGWQDLCPIDHNFIAFPSVSLRQFELAMASQAQPGPLKY